MASGLAARIKDIFGIASRLIEGHNGIYEVAINGQVIVTNRGKCGQTPSEEKVLEEIRKYKAPLQGREKMVRTTLPTIS